MEQNPRPALLDPSRARALNALGLLAVSLVLIIAFADQFFLSDLPCPLCILQRVGFLGVAFGLALNVKFGPRPGHYAIAILSAVLGGFISTRQVLLHVVPGSGSYGGAISGLHFYTWALLLYIIIIVGCAALLLFERQFAPAADTPRTRLGVAALALIAALALGNGVSTVLECGSSLCPDNPTSYQLLGN